MLNDRTSIIYVTSKQVFQAFLMLKTRNIMTEQTDRADTAFMYFLWTH